MFKFTAYRGKLAFAGAVTTSIGLFSVNYLPNTFFLDNYRSFVQCYKNGEEKSVPEKVLHRLEKAMNILELKVFEQKLVKPFVVVGLDMFEAGSTNSKFGCALGLPSNFAYESEEDIEKNEILFQNRAIDWNCETGQKLKNAIVLSEDEQVFAMCKSLLEFQTQKILLNSLYPTLSFIVVYALGSSLNVEKQLLKKPFIVRGFMYVILGCFGLGLWSFCKDFTQVQYDKSIDEKLASLGDNFIKAGRNYYEKMLLKNITLRDLIGDESYTSKGNINYFIRNKSLPLTFRKQYFEQKLEP